MSTPAPSIASTVAVAVPGEAELGECPIRNPTPLPRPLATARVQMGNFGNLLGTPILLVVLSRGGSDRR